MRVSQAVGWTVRPLMANDGWIPRMMLPWTPGESLRLQHQRPSSIPRKLRNRSKQSRSAGPVSQVCPLLRPLIPFDSILLLALHGLCIKKVCKSVNVSNLRVSLCCNSMTHEADMVCDEARCSLVVARLSLPSGSDCHVAVSDVALGAEDRRLGSIASLQEREEINQQGTHHQTHPRQQQRWSPSPAMSPALTPAPDDSSLQTSDDALDEDAGAAAEVTTFPAAAIIGEAPAASEPQAGSKSRNISSVATPAQNRFIQAILLYSRIQALFGSCLLLLAHHLKQRFACRFGHVERGALTTKTVTAAVRRSLPWTGAAVPCPQWRRP